jgi:hypothetical protein
MFSNGLTLAWCPLMGMFRPCIVENLKEAFKKRNDRMCHTGGSSVAGLASAAGPSWVTNYADVKM